MVPDVMPGATNEKTNLHPHRLFNSGLHLAIDQQTHPARFFNQADGLMNLTPVNRYLNNKILIFNCLKCLD